MRRSIQMVVEVFTRRNSDFRQRLRHRGRQWLNQQLRMCIQTVRQFDRQSTVKSSILNVFTSFNSWCNRLIQLSHLVKRECSRCYTVCYRPLGLHCDMSARCCLRPYMIHPATEYYRFCCRAVNTYGSESTELWRYINLSIIIIITIIICKRLGSSKFVTSERFSCLGQTQWPGSIKYPRTFLGLYY